MTTSVDFDYNGPPVTVSNGMVVQVCLIKYFKKFKNKFIYI